MNEKRHVDTQRCQNYLRISTPIFFSPQNVMKERILSTYLNRTFLSNCLMSMDKLSPWFVSVLFIKWIRNWTPSPRQCESSYDVNEWGHNQQYIKQETNNNTKLTLAVYFNMPVADRDLINLLKVSGYFYNKSYRQTNPKQDGLKGTIFNKLLRTH